MRQIYPVPAGSPEVAVADLARLYAYPGQPSAPWVRANMVASVDGAATLAGRSGGLSGGADRLIFNLLRGLADVILVGAGTVRAEGYGPAHPDEAADLWADLRAGRPARPAIAVVTRRLDLDPAAPLLTGAPADARTIVLTTSAAPADRRAAIAATADVVVAGDGAVDLRAAVAALAARGYRRILAEGGPRLLGAITGSGLLDELCLTVSPLLAGGGAGRIIDAAGAAAAGAAGDILAGAEPEGGPSPGSLGKLTLGHVLADEDYLLCRYLRAG
jgi:riboflavin biosynthesis pyrimidine reductase